MMRIKKLNLLEIRRQKFKASCRQIKIDHLLRQTNLEIELRKALVKVLVLLAKLKFRCDELERVSDNIQQTIIHGY